MLRFHFGPSKPFQICKIVYHIKLPSVDLNAIVWVYTSCLHPDSSGPCGQLAVVCAMGGRFGRSSLSLQSHHAHCAAALPRYGSTARGTRRQVSLICPSYIHIAASWCSLIKSVQCKCHACHVAKSWAEVIFICSQERTALFLSQLVLIRTVWKPNTERGLWYCEKPWHLCWMH